MHYEIRQYIRKGNDKKYIGKKKTDDDKFVDAIFIRPAPKKGIMVAESTDKKIFIGFSMCDKEDTFNREFGLNEAAGKAQATFDATYEQMFNKDGLIPHSIRGNIFAFLKRVERVKAFEGKELPAWAKTALIPQ